MVSFKPRHNKVLLAEVDGLRMIDWTIELSRNEWLSKVEEKANPFALVYSVDANIAKVSDYSKALIPPPYSLYSIDAGDIIVGHSINGDLILLITLKEFRLYKYTENKIIKTWHNTQE